MNTQKIDTGIIVILFLFFSLAVVKNLHSRHTTEIDNYGDAIDSRIMHDARSAAPLPVEERH
ncbi:MAG: hypothetical protein K8F91_14375 [Candidatus Obscuribacterales bacterium]|nr:hypothetical protein [Candidatus Obscuribacterales bacterium]